MNLQNPQVSSSSSLAGTRTQELDRAKERDRVLHWSQFGVGQCSRGRVPEHLPPPQSPFCFRSPPQVSRRTWVRHGFPLARSPPEPQRPPPPARPGPPRQPLWPSSPAPPGRSRSISEKPAAKLSGNLIAEIIEGGKMVFIALHGRRHHVSRPRVGLRRTRSIRCRIR